MINYSAGDMFAAGHNVLVIPTNSGGVMGAGVAREAANRWPSIAAAERRKGRSGTLRIGALNWYAPGGGWSVVTLPTKVHWRDDSRLEYVDAGLLALAAAMYDATREYQSWNIGIPALGCGLGKLQWTDVHALYRRHIINPTITAAHSITFYLSANMKEYTP